MRVNEGDLSGALESLRKAHEIAPEDAEIRTLVVSTFLAALRDDFERPVLVFCRSGARSTALWEICDSLGGA